MVFRRLVTRRCDRSLWLRLYPQCDGGCAGVRNTAVQLVHRREPTCPFRGTLKYCGKRAKCTHKFDIQKCGSERDTILRYVGFDINERSNFAVCFYVKGTRLKLLCIGSFVFDI